MVAHDIVVVVAVRNGLVPTARAMVMRDVMAAANMTRRALDGVGAIDFEPMLVDVIPVRMVEVSVVKIVNVVIVANCSMPAPGSMLMFVGIMDVVAHGVPPRASQDT